MKRGSQTIEGSLVFLLFLGILFLLIDTGWIVFTKATLQHAVREGVRYAITSRTSGGLGHVASIKSVVQQNAMGLLSSSDDEARIQVEFRSPETQAEVTGANSNQGGNLVMVSVVNYQIRPLMPLLHSGAPIQVTVRAGDRMEGSPGGVPPTL